MTDKIEKTASKSPMIIYVGDPMCSWCYGFAPIYKEIQETYADKVKTMMIMGGLRPGTKGFMDEKTKTTIAHHWVEVEKRTGQPFDHSLFDREDFVYDTEIPARAVVTLRQTHPEKEWEFYERIQSAFYSEAADTNKVEVYQSILKEMNLDLKLDLDEFTNIFNSQQMKEATYNDFALSRKMGVTGYPTVLLHAQEQLSVLTMGYQPLDNLIPIIDNWIKTFEQE